MSWAEIEFDSAGLRCRGRLARPDDAGDSRLPCVILAHGFGATKEGRLAAFAERFAQAGMAALLFDYRHFGDSEGEPRQVISIRRQHEDWHAAVAYARTRSDLDPDRIALWGTSFSGGHVVRIASRDKRIAAVVSQVPFASGMASVAATPPKAIAAMLPRAVADLARDAAGMDPVYFPTVGPEGSAAVLTRDSADEKYRAMFPEEKQPPNFVAARIGLMIGSYNPVRDASGVECPLLVVVAEGDSITPPGPARKMAERAPRGELVAVPGGHFEAYFGPTFEQVVAAETEFLANHLLNGPNPQLAT